MGTRVRISGPPGVCVGRIEDIRAINELPPVPGFAEVKRLRRSRSRASGSI
jgi:hypothetical protein